MAERQPRERDPVRLVNRGVNGVLAALASISLLAMMLLIVGNMFRRTVAAPFPGAFEVVGWLAAITAALALGYTQLHKGHVDIDIVTRLLGQKLAPAWGQQVVADNRAGASGNIGAVRATANWTASWTYGLNAGNRGVTPWWE